MHKHTFPALYGTDCVLVELDAALLPLIIGQVEMMLQRRYWLSEEDYLLGKSATAEAIAAMAGNCTQAIIDSNDRLYRLLDTALYNRTYVDVDGVIEPAIPAIPPDPAMETYTNLWTIANVSIQTRDKLTLLEETVRLMTLPFTGSDVYAFGGVTLYDLLQAINALTSGMPVPGDYASVLSTIAFNTGLTRANAGIGYQVGARQLCCDSATVEPLPSLNSRPDDIAMCQGLQALADGFLDVINALNIYHTRATYPDANSVLAIANQQLLARTLPQLSGTAAQEVVTAMYGETRGGTAWNTWYGDGDKETYRLAVYTATQADQASNLAGQWVDTLAFMPDELKAIVRPIIADQGLYNALFDGLIDASSYDGSLCSGEPPAEATISSVFGAQFDNLSEAIETGTHHYYAENASGATYYRAVYSWNIVSGTDTHALNRTGEVDDVRGDALFGYFPNDWEGVQLKILEGPEDVALHFPAPSEHPDITLSSTDFTTLPPGAAGFTIYAASDDHAPYTPFTLSVIFP